jgi:Zn-dependent oligopeptidase
MSKSKIKQPKVPNATTMAEFLHGMDFKLLKEQKTRLINIQSKLSNRKAKFTQKDWDVLEGIICLCDKIQDIAVDDYGYNERTVFRRTREK